MWYKMRLELLYVRRVLTWNTRKLFYVRQTSCNFKQRNQEHIRYIKQNDRQSANATHTLNYNHEYGTINTTMSLLKQTTKISILIPYEQFYMQSQCYHKETHTGTKHRWTQSHVPVIFNTPITSPSAIYTDQYSDTHQLPRPQYWTHSSTYKTAYTLGTYNILISLYVTFQNNVLHFLKNF